MRFSVRGAGQCVAVSGQTVRNFQVERSGTASPLSGAALSLQLQEKKE